MSFDLRGSTFWGRPDGITASAAGTSATFMTPNAGTNNDWYHETMTFVASSASTVIDLQSEAGFTCIGLDNASVDLVSTAPVSEHGSMGLVLAGLLAVAASAARRARR